MQLSHFDLLRFHGRENEKIGLFIESYERIAKVHGWENEQLTAVFPSCLGGRTQLFYYNLPREIKETDAHLRIEFVTNYRSLEHIYAQRNNVFNKAGSQTVTRIPRRTRKTLCRFRNSGNHLDRSSNIRSKPISQKICSNESTQNLS